MLRALLLLSIASWTSSCAPRADAIDAQDEPGPSATDVSAGPGPIVGELGTAHPVTIQGVSPTGHWLAICQARADTDGDGRIDVSIGEHGEIHGDEMRPYLVRTAGAGAPIEAFIHSDPSGRHVAVVKTGGRVALLDTWNDSELELARADPHRAVSFDAGRRAAWAEQDGDTALVVVRDLEVGSERRIDVGTPLLWRFELDPSGEWVWMWTIENDTDANGKLELPRAMTSLSERRCLGGAGTFGHYGRYGDQPSRRVAKVEDGAVATLATGALGVLGDALLVRMPDASILRRDDDGEHELVPAACGARVVHADEPSKSLWVACTSQKRTKLNYELAPLHRFGIDMHEDVHLEVDVVAQDVWNAGGPYLYTADRKFVNLTTGTVGRPIGARTHLFWEDGVVYDTTQRSVQSILAEMPAPDEAHGRSLARATSGETLVAARNDGYGLAVQGPLRWLPRE